MTMVIQSVFNEERLAKLESLKAATGMTNSEIIRRLVDAAEVEPMRVKARLATNTNSDTTGQGASVAVAA